MGDYRQLCVWKRAHKLALEVYRSTECCPARERYGLAAQMRRAAVSVISNIAEGCGRQGDKELTRFLRIARGSVRELDCQMLFCRDLGYVPKEVWAAMEVESDEISRMLNGLIRSFHAGLVDRTNRRPLPGRALTPDSRLLTPDPDS